MNNDISSNLRLVRAWSKSSLVSRLVEMQGYGEDKQSSWSWKDDLRLLTPDSRNNRLLRYAIPNKHERIEYTALSYLWSSSLYEEAATYTWHIEVDDSLRRANVRDAVLDRVSKFMTHFELDYLWIDLECIDQLDEDEKRRVMGKMHQIYARSFCPLALLFVPIRTTAELNILTRLLQDDLVEPARRRKRSEDEGHDSDVYVLTSNMIPDEAYAILDLIHRLLSDDWWSRAWCFQEEYVSMKKMTLLLPTFVDVTQRVDNNVISFMDGEVAISSRDFRRAVTRFVFAYVVTAKRYGTPWVLDKGVCRHILEKAGWYTFMSVHGHTLNLESKGKALTTQILADIRGKKYTVPSDLIHISTNCNLYPVTLNTRRLNEENESLALSILTLFFLNGEIFKNGPKDGPSSQEAADLNAFEYLRHIAFDAFRADGGPGQLAWLRRHRFVSPLLTPNGIQTIGHVWQIDQILPLPTTIWHSILSSQSSESSASSDANADEQTVLVLSAIRDNLPARFASLRRAITGFLEHKFDLYWQNERAANADALSVTAAELATAVRDGSHVGLGHILDFKNERSPAPVKLGLFPVNQVVSVQNPLYAFTAWQVRSSKKHRHHQHRFMEDRHISLQVGIDERQDIEPRPSLRTRARIHHLCFCAGFQRTSVVFPWPRSLLE